MIENKSRRRVEIGDGFRRKVGVIRNPLDNLAASPEQNVTAFGQNGGDMPTLLRSSEQRMSAYRERPEVSGAGLKLRD